MDYSNFLLFCERWQKKANNEKPDGELDQCFDHFFTSFVIYNRIYNFCYFLNHNDPDDYKDRESAVDKMIEFAEENSVTNSIMEQIAPYVARIARLLSMGRFYIHDIYNNDETKKRKEQDKEEKLKQNLSLPNIPKNQKAILKEVLVLLYKVRCNMFHGEKEYIPQQFDLLIPLNHILDILNATMLDILRDKYKKNKA